MDQEPLNKTVLIGIPSHHGEIDEQTQRSLDALIRKSHQAGVGLVVSRAVGSLICRNRNEIVNKALEVKADYLLFIDSDMVFDDDALLRLLDLNRNIVSGLCVSKQPPFHPVAKRKNENGKYAVVDGLAEGRFYSDLDGVGAAFMLVNTDVFHKVEAPWFAMPPYGKEVLGEDFYFCQKAIDADFQICCDASLIIGHIGHHIYTINDYIEYKAERERREKEVA